MQGKTICDMCGKEFDMWDKQESRCFYDQFGYGSKYDGDNINLDLCCNCFDKVIDWIVPQCKHNPIIDQYDIK